MFHARLSRTPLYTIVYWIREDSGRKQEFWYILQDILCRLYMHVVGIRDINKNKNQTVNYRASGQLEIVYVFVVGNI